MTKERLKYLLDRLLENQATEEELKEYADWYEATGANGPAMQDDHTTKEYTTSLYSRIAHAINENEQTKKRSKRIIFMRWAAAASVILIAGTFFFYNVSRESKPAGSAEVNAAQQRASTSRKVNFENNDQKNRKIKLEDGSVVELFPGSQLACEFKSNAREIHLTGRGFFKVARDSSKPFTVYSNDISTTALGTSFTISAYSGNNEVQVSLHTGKAVVKQIQPGAEKMKDVYLVPGQSLLYNSVTGKTTLQSLNTPVAPSIHKHAASGSKTGYEATFNQAPLTAVLDAIEKGYAVPIEYNRSALSEIYFSGQILETDSLARVLKRIALLHNLRIISTTKGYRIRKDH